IAGAAVVYLLLAIVWAYAYRAIGVIQPGSFAIADAQNITQSLALYYSFVTITTLGYGDIFPVTTAAKSCAILEAIIGQLYLVITIALLVGVYVSQSLAKKGNPDKAEKQE
ncbi:MAG: two pore domain potassium channel family protein, partial [Deltaproteobacteria bacterium]|nr:two pore domain potassium channel family protein [Deltaproteobacteria bacterium]